MPEIAFRSGKIAALLCFMILAPACQRPAKKAPIDDDVLPEPIEHVEIKPVPPPESELETALKRVRAGQTDTFDLRKVSKSGDKEVAQLTDVPNLKRLILDKAPVTNAAMKTVGTLTSLHTLAMCETQVDDAGLAHLRKLTNLETLRLDKLRITDAGLDHVNAFPKLKHLSLWRTLVTDDGMVHVANLTNLEHISLDETRVTDEGVKALSGLTRLRHLTLWKTRVTDAGAAHLAALTNLEFLSLDETRVTDEGIKALHGLTRLKHLKLWRTNVTPAGAMDFQQKLPACKIGGLKLADDAEQK